MDLCRCTPTTMQKQMKAFRCRPTTEQIKTKSYRRRPTTVLRESRRGLRAGTMARVAFGANTPPTKHSRRGFPRRAPRNGFSSPGLSSGSRYPRLARVRCADCGAPAGAARKSLVCGVAPRRGAPPTFTARVAFVANAPPTLPQLDTASDAFGTKTKIQP